MDVQPESHSGADTVSLCVPFSCSRVADFHFYSNWGTETDADFQYHNGNRDPKGFGKLYRVSARTCEDEGTLSCCILGHIGIAVPDVYKACERFEKLGVNFVKKPDGGMYYTAYKLFAGRYVNQGYYALLAGKMKGLAFITDPDGYWIEILNGQNMAK